MSREIKKSIVQTEGGKPEEKKEDTRKCLYKREMKILDAGDRTESLLLYIERE